MTKYLKLFDKHSSYNNFLQSADFLTPNVSHCIMEQDVHYNPISIEVSGKFTVPSRLYNIHQSGGDGGIIEDDYVYYGLKDGVKFGAPTISLNEGNEIVNAEYAITNDSYFDENENKQYKLLNINFYYVNVDDGNNEQIFGYNKINPEDNETYYFAQQYTSSARLDENGHLEFGYYYYDYDYSQEAWYKHNLPKISVKTANYFIRENNFDKYKKGYINCFHNTDVQGDYGTLVDYEGDITFEESDEYKYLILPLHLDSNLINKIDGIKIDKDFINLDDLSDNGGWLMLDEGVHNVTYFIKKEAIRLGYLYPDIFSGVPIEEVVLDRRIKGCFLRKEIDQEYNYLRDAYTAFDNCALLGTDEETIMKICKIKDIENKKIIEPLVFECEYDVADNIINYGEALLSNANYFAIYNGKVGMHVCSSTGTLENQTVFVENFLDYDNQPKRNIKFITYNISDYSDFEFSFKRTSLSNIILPEGLKKLTSNPFYGCTNLPVVNGLRYADYILCGYVDKTMTDVSIKEGTKIIASGVFECENDEVSALQSVTIPSSVTEIGSSAFWHCRNLTNVNIPNDSQLVTIGNSAFGSCSSLTSINIPSSVTSCSALTSINIPSGVTEIGSNFFYACSSLTSVTFESGSQLTNIGRSAFQECSSLTNVTIPNGVTIINDSTFKNCSNLESVTIPDGVTTIGLYAFQGCSNLTSINIPSSVTGISSLAFDGCSSLPVENHIRYADTYAIALTNYRLSSYIIKNGTRLIGISCFSGSDLTSITIPSSVTHIGSKAFYLCRSLTSVTFESGSQLTTIEGEAFCACSSLTSMTIPSSVTEIGYWSLAAVSQQHHQKLGVLFFIVTTTV